MTIWNEARQLGLVSLLSMGLATGVLAQSTDNSEASEGAGVDSELSLGEDLNAVPEVGQPYIKEKVGDFDLRCVRTENPETDPCQLYQLLVDDEQQPVAEFSLFRLPEGSRAAAGATIVVPLETALQAQLTITVDSGSARRYPYSFCNRVGCYARIGFTGDDINAFKRGNVAKLTIVPVLAQDQKVDLNMSLAGFTAGIDKASVLNQ